MEWGGWVEWGDWVEWGGCVEWEIWLKLGRLGGVGEVG